MEACGLENSAVHCYKTLPLTLRSKGRCAIKPRSAPELGRWAAKPACRQAEEK
jgi:hypothetical protein